MLQEAPGIHKRQIKPLISSMIISTAVFSSLVHADTTATERRSDQSVRQTQYSSNNQGGSRHGHNWRANSPYRRLSPAWYADGVAEPVDRPNARYISNRIFADGTQNLFSETGVTQWAYTWGQFIDHTVALRETGEEIIEVTLDPDDPLENFDNSGNNLIITRSAAAPGTGTDSPREQLNTISSRIDAWAVYGGNRRRLEWLLEGPVDQRLANNQARLLMPYGYLPVRSARGDASQAPVMETVGMLLGSPSLDDEQVVAGDIRANENIALTTIQTLFAREHNRIVDALPSDWSESRKFAAARQLVIATQQYITYNEFLPALGVYLDDAHYSRRADPRITQEFATVGYRAHSMIHGEIELEVPVGYYDNLLLSEFEAMGIPFESDEQSVEIAVPLNLAHGNPALVRKLGVGQIARALAAEPQYKNDEQIDNQLRSVLFQLPIQTEIDDENCLDGELLPECYRLVSDLGVLDIVRGREHGIAPYNVLRTTYGLDAAEDFTDITGEDTEEFPDDALIDPTDPINDPDILDFVALFDSEGQPIELDSEEAEGEAVTGVRRSTLAARLKAIYQDVDAVDAFVGMVSEPHVAGSDFGELQYEIWKKQFEDLRDGSKDFYLWNKTLQRLMQLVSPLGLSYEQSLSDIIANNTDLLPEDVPASPFVAVD